MNAELHTIIFDVARKRLDRHDLKLECSKLLNFEIWELEHPIDEDSPLVGLFGWSSSIRCSLFVWLASHDSHSMKLATSNTPTLLWFLH